MGEIVFKNVRISLRIPIFVFGLTVLSALTTGLLTYRTMTNWLENDSAQRLRFIGVDIVEDLGETQKSMVEDVSSLAVAVSWIHGGELRNTMRAFVDNHSNFQNAAILDLSGSIRSEVYVDRKFPETALAAILAGSGQTRFAGLIDGNTVLASQLPSGGFVVLLMDSGIFLEPLKQIDGLSDANAVALGPLVSSRRLNQINVIENVEIVRDLSGGEGVVVTTEGNPAGKMMELRQAIDLFGQSYDLTAVISYDRLLEARTMFLKTMSAIVQASSLGFVLAATLFVRRSLEPLRRLENCLLSIVEQRDLSVRVPVEGKDEIGSSATAVNDLLDMFETFVAETAQGATQMEGLSRSLASAASQLSSEAENRAASVEELSSMLHQTAGQAMLAVDAAGAAAASMGKAQDYAETGEARIDEMVEAVGRIAVSANDIAKIMEVINEIAFQTNILALNASVEAARAGQHGKGFAVVANEVGSLAKRSSEAVGQTGRLIEESLKNVAKGEEVAVQTRTAFGKIVDQVRQADLDIRQISTAIGEQKTSVDVASATAVGIVKSASADTIQNDKVTTAASELLKRSTNVRGRIDQFKHSAV